MTRIALLPVRAALSLAPVLVPVAAPAQSRPAAAVSSSARPSSSAPQGLRARAVEFTVRSPLPAGVPSDLLPFHRDGEGGYEIAYVVRGTGLSSVVGDSLRISSATAGGADVSKDADGGPACSMAPFPEVAKDGSAARFTLRLAPGRGRLKPALPVVHGTIEVERSEGVEKRTAALSVSPGSSARLGPLTVTVRAPKEPKAPEAGAAFDGDDAPASDAGDAPGAAFAAALAAAAKEGAGGSGAPSDAEAAAAMAAFFGGMLGGGDDGDDLALEIAGPNNAIASLVLVEDGEELPPGMRVRFSPERAVWHFPAPSGASVQVRAEIRKGLRRETVSF